MYAHSSIGTHTYIQVSFNVLSIIVWVGTAIINNTHNYVFAFYSRLIKSGNFLGRTLSSRKRLERENSAK